MVFGKKKEANDWAKAVREDVDNEANYTAEEAKASLTNNLIYQLQAQQFASEGYNTHQNYTTHFEPDDFYVVWFSKVLKNWKALLSTDKVNNGVYIEVIYNGESDEAYVDVYYKHQNVVLNFK